MFARLRDWLFGGATENLPERVREAIRQQQDRSEIIIGWAELLLVGLLAVAYETTTMAAGVAGAQPATPPAPTSVTPARPDTTSS